MLHSNSRRSRWVLAVLLTLALVASACGGTSDPGGIAEPPDTGVPGPTELVGTPTPTVLPPTPTAPPLEPDPGQGQLVLAGHAAVLVYFDDHGSARAVTRLVPKPLVATYAMIALLEGPMASEEAAGLGTAIPSGTNLRGVTINNGVATVDVTGAFETGGGISAVMSRLGQVVYTLTQFSTVDRVSFELDGQPVTRFSSEGVDLSSPVDRSFFGSIFPIVTADPIGVPLWSTPDLAGLDGGPDSSFGTVVLVTADDVLNVREGPGVSSSIVGMLQPGARVLLTGEHDHVGNSTWVELETPLGAHWVNRFYLAGDMDPIDFAADSRIEPLIGEFVEILETRGDLTPVTSRRGMFVAHNSSPVHIKRSDLDTVLTDPSKSVWQAADGVNPAEPQTFVEAVADSFLGVFDAAHGQGLRNEWENPAAGLPAGANPIPFELGAFNYVGYHNSTSDVTQQVSWYVSIDYEAGRPYVVAVTLDSWTP